MHIGCQAMACGMQQSYARRFWQPAAPLDGLASICLLLNPAPTACPSDAEPHWPMRARHVAVAVWMPSCLSAQLPPPGGLTPCLVMPAMPTMGVPSRAATPPFSPPPPRRHPFACPAPPPLNLNFWGGRPTTPLRTRRHSKRPSRRISSRRASTRSARPDEPAVGAQLAAKVLSAAKCQVKLGGLMLRAECERPS